MVQLRWYRHGFPEAPLANPNNNSTCLEILYGDNITYQFDIRREELEFPLAYSILVFDHLERVIRLLKAIYREHNHYCVHVDRKSPSWYSMGMRRAATCLGSNVYIVPDDQRVNVKWGRITVLEPEIICARILHRASRKWKYWINLTGQEFPLRTNWELVTALRALNGTNSVEAIYRRRDMDRFPRMPLSFNVSC